MDYDWNLMSFLNIDSSIMCLFFFEKGYRLFEKYLGGEQTGFLPTPVSPFLKSRKIVGGGSVL